MEKSNDKGTALTIGLITAFATICAALIGGVFLVYSTVLNRSTPPSPSQNIPGNFPPPASSEPTLEPTKPPWVPGAEHPQYAHVIASDTEGIWIPDAGYDWVDPANENDLQVVWAPGSPHDEYPNVVASETIGDWVPAPGYKWADPDNEDDFTVVRVLASIENVVADYNVSQDGQTGMNIHVKFTIEELQDIRCHIGAYFFDANTGDALAAGSGDYSTSNGYAMVGSEFLPTYRSTTFEDFVLFMPYEALKIDPVASSAELKFIVKLYNWRDETFIAESEEYLFTYTP
jgi:hypothetical protein